MHHTTRRPRIHVTTGGDQIVSHVGARLLADLADQVGLTAELSAALASTKQRRRGPDRGQVVTDLAVAIADGATTFSDFEVLAHQPALFGSTASVSTVWRTLQALDSPTLLALADARARARRHVWDAGLDPGFYVIDIDGTLITSHSDKDGAAPTYKRG